MHSHMHTCVCILLYSLYTAYMYYSTTVLQYHYSTRSSESTYGYIRARVREHIALCMSTYSHHHLLHARACVRACVRACMWGIPFPPELIRNTPFGTTNPPYVHTSSVQPVYSTVQPMYCSTTVLQQYYSTTRALESSLSSPWVHTRACM